MAIDLNNYLSTLEKAIKNLQSGLLEKTLKSDYDLYEEYIIQIEWLVDNKDYFIEQAVQQNKEQELNILYERFLLVVKEHSNENTFKN